MIRRPFSAEVDVSDLLPPAWHAAAPSSPRSRVRPPDAAKLWAGPNSAAGGHGPSGSPESAASAPPTLRHWCGDQLVFCSGRRSGTSCSACSA